MPDVNVTIQDAQPIDVSIEDAQPININLGELVSVNGGTAWGDITGTLSDQTDLDNALSAKTDDNTLATVAKSGDYTDLINQPTIPTNNNQLTNGAGYITASSTDTLTNKSGNVSQFTNDSGYLTSHQDISGKVDKTTKVNGHALNADVTVTKADVGLGNVTDDAQLKDADKDTDGTLTANSDNKIPSQKAVKTYVDTKHAPAGSNTQVQYNSSGSFAGSANLTFDNSTNTLSTTNISASGTINDAKLKRSGSNVGLGFQPFFAGTGNDNNTAIGYDNQTALTSGSGNTSVGMNTLKNVTSGGSNNAVGNNAMVNNTSGFNNVAMGVNAMRNNTSGGGNVAIGYGASYGNYSGTGNTAVGINAMVNNSTSNNTGVGHEALNKTTSGNYNSGVGSQSLHANTTGSEQVGVGYRAGRYIADGSTANETSANSVYLGSQTKAQADGDTNEIVIGYDAIGNGSNTVTLGNGSVTDVYTSGKLNSNGLNIGTVSPPASASASGTKGEIAYDSNYIYVCIATDTWKRVGISSW